MSGTVKLVVTLTTAEPPYWVRGQARAHLEEFAAQTGDWIVDSVTLPGEPSSPAGLTQADFGCNHPGHDHGHDGDEPLSIKAACHPAGALRVQYQGGSLRVTCAEDDALVAEIAVAAT